MKKEKHLFSKFKKIHQFRHIVKEYNQYYNRTYNEETKQVVIDRYKPKETLKFLGTPKNHGTNALITLTKDLKLGVGKRSSALSLEEPNGHFGFPAFVSGNTELLTELIQTIKTINGIGDKDVVLYGEWSGKGVQKNVAVSEVPKHFYVFDFKIVEKTHTEDETINRYINAVEWYKDLPTSLVEKLNERGVIFAPQVKTYEIDIDMESPMKATEELEKLTLEVEAECPIGKFFGVDGTGEGIVWVHKGTNISKRNDEVIGDFSDELKEWLNKKMVDGINHFQVEM